MLAVADAAGRRSVFSLFDTNLQVPYTIQSMISVQRSFGNTMAAEVSYLRTDGNDFPLQRQFTQAFDRQTGVRPNPALGAPGGYYIDSSQTMVYNGLQTALRKRFSNRYSWDVNYTLGKSVATQGGDLSAYYIAAFENNQDFFDPEFDRGPASNDIRHRFNALVHLRAPRDPRRPRRAQQRPRWLAALRHPADTIGQCAASPAAIGHRPQPARRRPRRRPGVLRLEGLVR